VLSREKQAIVGPPQWTEALWGADSRGGRQREAWGLPSMGSTVCAGMVLLR